MTHPLVQEGAEYITKADFDEAIEGLNRGFGALLDAVKEELLLAIHREVDNKIESAQRDSLQQMKGLLDKRVEDEAKQRKEDVADVKIYVKTISESTHRELSQLDDKLQPLMRNVDEIIGRLDIWSKAMDSNQQLFEDAKEDLRDQAQMTEKVRADVETIKTAQTKLTEQQQVLRQTIHGNADEDGPPSIYSMLSNIETNVGEFKGLAEKNSERLAKIEAEQDAQKKKWAERWETAKSISKSKQFWGIVALSIVAIAVVIRPETQGFFTNLPLINLFVGN
jgi:hypothetical protein